MALVGKCDESKVQSDSDSPDNSFVQRRGFLYALTLHRMFLKNEIDESLDLKQFKKQMKGIATIFVSNLPYILQCYV